MIVSSVLSVCPARGMQWGWEGVCRTCLPTACLSPHLPRGPPDSSSRRDSGGRAATMGKLFNLSEVWSSFVKLGLTMPTS